MDSVSDVVSIYFIAGVGLLALGGVTRLNGLANHRLGTVEVRN